jgi:hypothetical protein
MSRADRALAITCLSFVLLIIVIVSVALEGEKPPAPAPPSHLVILANPYSGNPMATFDRETKTLTIAHVPADALVCLRGVCKLEAEWLAK